jgi:Rps23 Pro-64 3,4-dihydroxylase Tpa1-like proline 4-hydroxylase
VSQRDDHLCEAVPGIFNKIPRYELVPGWLGEDTVERLLQFAQSNEHRFEDTQVGEEGRLDHTRRVSKWVSLGHLKADLRGKLAHLLPVIFERLGIRPFVPSKIEVELVAHGDGAFFLRHIDTQVSNRRVISAVYYFHALPRAFSGGVLRLHSLAATGQQYTFVDIAPNYDTLVFFPSFYPHEVLPVKCASRQFLDSRFAINFWVNRG